MRGQSPWQSFPCQDGDAAIYKIASATSLPRNGVNNAEPTMSMTERVKKLRQQSLEAVEALSSERAEFAR